MSKVKKGVKLEHISKIYQDPKTGKDFYAVKDTSLTIEPGSFVTLLGPSGCGKTTTLRMIAGFESPDEGEIYLGDEAINALTPNKRDTAMVFQSYALLPHYNVFDNVAYGLKLRKVAKNEIQERVMRILDLVELTGMEGRMTNQLSGGQQQRVALARALVIEPSVLLFDEPLSNLDAKLRVSMRTEIRRIQQEVGITAIYVTHDQSEAMALSDNIIIMNKGVVAQMGTPQEIYYHPGARQGGHEVRRDVHGGAPPGVRGPGGPGRPALQGDPVLLHGLLSELPCDGGQYPGEADGLQPQEQADLSGGGAVPSGLRSGVGTYSVGFARLTAGGMLFRHTASFASAGPGQDGAPICTVLNPSPVFSFFCPPFPNDCVHNKKSAGVFNDTLALFSLSAYHSLRGMSRERGGHARKRAALAWHYRHSTKYVST